MKREFKKLRSGIILVEKAIKGEPYIWVHSATEKVLVSGTISEVAKEFNLIRINRATAAAPQLITMQGASHQNREFRFSRRNKKHHQQLN